MFWDINGNRIYIVECSNCGHQIGFHTGNPDDYPSLEEIGEKEKCCDNPHYLWRCSGTGIPNNFSRP